MQLGDPREKPPSIGGFSGKLSEHWNFCFAAVEDTLGAMKGATDKGKTVEELADEYGIDLSLIQANLRLSPTERLRQHDRHLNTMLKLRAAMEKKHG